MIKVGMVSLGCSKNQVDAERMMATLQKSGMVLESNPALCDAVIVNTCGFIEDAKKESIENIFEFVQMKEEGNLKVVAVTGCLAERYQEEIAQDIPEADVILGIGSMHNIVGAIQNALEGERVVSFGSKELLSLEGPRVLANPEYFAYLKIAEGCDNFCTFCAIPMIRGGFRSRPMENIIEEARTLGEQGVVELNVVAQDSTRYGEDLYGKIMLPELLKELCKIPQIQWIRLIYCYPERVTDELIQVVAEEEKIVPYIDMPLQHNSDPVLKRMNRPETSEDTRVLIAKLRQKIPNVVLRTTLIAGFPGETEEDFQRLCEFVQEAKFERLGCFAYSQEENTPAAKLPNQLDEETKRRRADTVMEMQMNIIEEFSQSCVGKKFSVLVEHWDADENCFVGRTYMDAPEVDGTVYLKNEVGLVPGTFVQAEIIQAQGYDLVGKVVKAE